jgi:hypothetical protein
MIRLYFGMNLVGVLLAWACFSMHRAGYFEPWSTINSPLHVTGFAAADGSTVYIDTAHGTFRPCWYSNGREGCWAVATLPLQHPPDYKVEAASCHLGMRVWFSITHPQQQIVDCIQNSVKHLDGSGNFVHVVDQHNLIWQQLYWHPLDDIEASFLFCFIVFISLIVSAVTVIALDLRQPELMVDG